MRFQKKYIGWIAGTASGLVIVSLLLRLFVVDFYIIPSSSMKPVLKPGDRIMVNKLYFGARMYRNLDFVETGHEPQVWRVKRYSPLRRNEVVVFNFPYKGKNDTIKMNVLCFYVKRCIALPGDTLSIDNGYYRVNGRRGYGNMDAQKHLSEMQWLTESGRMIYPFRKGWNWNIQNAGPMTIPARGTRIKMNPELFTLYSKQMIYETHARFKCSGDTVLMDGVPLKEYIFTHNWYFLAGDDVLNSQDCRYIGFIPEEYIIGKVAMILTAKDWKTKKYQWKRFFTVL